MLFTTDGVFYTTGITMKTAILIIDNTGNGPVLADLLHQDDCPVTTVTNALYGLQELDTGRYGVTIVLDQPGVDSRYVCELIRNVSSCPLIIINPDADTETCVKAIQAGADYFLRRPFGPLELRARVVSLLQRSPTRTASATSDILE